MLYMYKVDTRNAYECEKYSHENLESKCANSFNSRRTFDSKSQFIEFFFAHYRLQNTAESTHTCNSRSYSRF